MFQFHPLDFFGFTVWSAFILTQISLDIFWRGHTPKIAHVCEMVELLGIVGGMEFYTKCKQLIKIRILRPEYMHLHLFLFCSLELI